MLMPATPEGAAGINRYCLFTEFPALYSGTTKQLAVLLLRHALATLLDH
jgi:hypothetical protein